MHQFGIIKKCFDNVDAQYKHEDYVGLFTAHVHKGTVLIQMTGTTQPVTQRHIPNYPHETYHSFSKIRSMHACANWKSEAYK